MSEQWTKSQIIESGNFPKNSFVGKLVAIYPADNEKLGGKVLKLDFEDGKTYEIPISSKDGQYGVHEDGQVDGFMAIGQFCASIERLDVKTGLPNMNNNDPNVKRFETFWGFMDGQPAGFKTEPDIVGCTLHNIATKRQVGDDQQTSKYPDWTIGQVEGMTVKMPAPKPAGAKKPAPKTTLKATDAELLTKIEDMLLENPALSVGQLYAAFGGSGKSPYTPAQIRAAIAEI